MESNKTVTSEDVYFGDGCDESKCISTGLSENGTFTCYGEKSMVSGSILYPMMCADGYSPVVVEDEDSVSWGGATEDPVLLNYFTCCPPDVKETDVAPSRHCSDPILAAVAEGDDEEDATANPVCDDETRRYAREMKSRGVYRERENFLVSAIDSFVCCDSESPEKSSKDGTQDFLGEVECVPFCDALHKECKIVNDLGFSWSISRVCNFPEDDFLFPRPIGEDMYRWQCCKSGPALPPFIHDDTFKMQTSVYLVLFSIGVITSAVVFLALMLPLLIQLKNGKFHEDRSGSVHKPRTSTTATANGSVAFSTASSEKSGNKRRTSVSGRERRGRKESRYSTYNLYLAYLALPDLMYCLSNALVPMIAFSQGATNGPLIISIGANGSIGNLWINAVISFELLRLLKGTQRAERVSPPSLKRVNIQVALVFLLVIASTCMMYFFLSQVKFATAIGDVETSDRFDKIFWTYYLIMIMPPIIYVVYAYIKVFCCGILPTQSVSTSLQNKRTRLLTIYFLRIVGVFFVVWIPQNGFIFLALFLGESWPFFVGYLLAACQPVATMCMILTKPDIRKHFVDLFTLSYCSKNPNEPEGPEQAISSNVSSAISSNISSAAVETSDSPDPSEEEPEASSEGPEATNPPNPSE